MHTTSGFGKARRVGLAASLLVLLGGSGAVRAQTLKLPVTADNSIIDVKKERSYNRGAVTAIRLKTYQHHLVVKVDTSQLAGKKVTKATLRYRKAASTLDHVTVSSIQGDWVEGKSKTFATDVGSSCFLAAQYNSDAAKLVPWSFPGSRFVDVVYGNGHSLVGTSKCPVVGGFYQWDISPDIVDANAVGASFGIAVFESSSKTNQNPTVYSREGSSSSNRPELVVTAVAGDPAPAAVSGLAAVTAGVDRGMARLTWKVPAGAFSYEVSVKGGSYSKATSVPRYLIPFAGAAGATESMLVRDILEPGKQYTVNVTAVARGGAKSAAATISFSPSAVASYPDMGYTPTLPPAAGTGHAAGDLKVWALPVTDKVSPDGAVLENKAAGYKDNNPVFDGKTVRLLGGRNDLLSFQLMLESKGAAQTGVTVTAAASPLTATLNPLGFVNTTGGLFAETILEPVSVYATDGDKNVGAGKQKVQPVLVELWAPATVKAGKITGKITVKGSAGQVTVPLEVEIVDASVPDAPTFKCEMNDYGYPDKLATFNALQTTARRFRTHVNLLTYSHTGRTRLDMVMLDGKRMSEAAYNNIKPGDTKGNWTEFTKSFSPLFDSTLYKGGPWPGAALPGYYTSFYESWPLLAKAHYKTGEKDAFKAFPVVYEQTFKGVLGDFVSLARGKGWTGAGFQVYLNNKPYSSDPDFTLVKGSTPWILDEPKSFWDFRALGYFGKLFADGAGKHAPVDIKYRIDISRYQYHRNQLDGVVDLAVVNPNLYLFRRLVFEHARRNGVEIWNYGTANPVKSSNLAAAGWVLSCYAMGCRGVLPWSTVKHGDKYLKGELSGDAQQRALFIVASDKNPARVVPTLRLAAFREGAQLAEYLELLRARKKATQGQMERLIRNYLSLDAAFSVSGKYAEDAGTISFKDLTSTQLWKLRKHVLQSLSTAPPLPDGGMPDSAAAGDGPVKPAGDGKTQDAGDDGGCGCTLSGQSGVLPPLALVILLLLWRRARS